VRPLNRAAVPSQALGTVAGRPGEHPACQAWDATRLLVPDGNDLVVEVKGWVAAAEPVQAQFGDLRGAEAGRVGERGRGRRVKVQHADGWDSWGVAPWPERLAEPGQLRDSAWGPVKPVCQPQDVAGQRFVGKRVEAAGQRLDGHGDRSRQLSAAADGPWSSTPCSSARGRPPSGSAGIQQQRLFAPSASSSLYVSRSITEHEADGMPYSDESLTGAIKARGFATCESSVRVSATATCSSSFAADDLTE
jgi:hypothetical protein